MQVMHACCRRSEAFIQEIQLNVDATRRLRLHKYFEGRERGSDV